MPTLYVVGTPIGNLQDMTPRAIDTLRRVALIAAEDTRVTKKLLTVFDIDTPLTACHQHNEDTKGAYLADKMLSDNIDIALTTDAGTPCISDPGYALVKACVDRGIEVLRVHFRLVRQRIRHARVRVLRLPAARKEGFAREAPSNGAPSADCGGA